ncbi:MAG: hypothetical protein AB1746_00455 [Candidatus Zixiibacteriota bacterium]
MNNKQKRENEVNLINKMILLGGLVAPIFDISPAKILFVQAIAVSLVLIIGALLWFRNRLVAKSQKCHEAQKRKYSRTYIKGGW